MTKQPHATTRRPEWLRISLRASTPASVSATADALADLGLATVCDGARCPNRQECYARGTATFMILGTHCTRNCRFCAVPHDAGPPAPSSDEPRRVAWAVQRMGLKYVVLTSVTRDDLPDGGASHFAAVVSAIKKQTPGVPVEVLVPDFHVRQPFQADAKQPTRATATSNPDREPEECQAGKPDVRAIATVLASGCDVFGHNIETVARLRPTVRPQANHQRSLDVLAEARRQLDLTPDHGRYTKSGLMVGLGETDDEVVAVLKELRDVGVDIVTIGQYLSPSAKHHPVDRFVEPEQFERWRQRGLDLGFEAVFAGPLVRSSYMAEQVFAEASPKR